MKKLFYLALLLIGFNPLLKAQVLHTENFNVILDSTKKVKGNLIPSFRYRNVRETFFEIENTADVAFNIKQHAFSIANKFEFARFGDQNIMSGGFVYLEYREPTSTTLVIEPYALLLWQEIRGLEIKVAAGANARWRLIYEEDAGLFAGAGIFYEEERWNYEGVSVPNDIPANPESIRLYQTRISTYVSYKKKFGDKFTLDLSAYFQPAVDDLFSNYRLATSSELTYKLTKYLGLSFLYQNIYDPNPVVPIDKLFNDVTVGLSFSF